MDTLARPVLTGGMTTAPSPTIQRAEPRRDQVLKAISRRSFCTLATSSAANRPHVAGVVYAVHEGALYVSTRRTSRKARNVAGNPHVSVCIPVRRIPVGPPSTVQLSATAEILAPDDPHIARLLEAGRLASITRHGELDLPDGCFLRITPTGTLQTYGLGLPLVALIRHPLEAGGRVDLQHPHELLEGDGRGVA
jgi:general stress protein 26